MRSTARKSILVVGGGFGGLSTVRALHKALHGRTDIAIALVNQENSCVFQPMLAEVISGNIGLLNTVPPLRDVCPGATLYVRTVERIDLDHKVVITGCSRCYLNPLIKVSIYNQWLMVSSRQIGIVLNASHDKKLHWGAQRVNP
jgi:NADH dehydrogenase FAD-containing subunit